MKQGSTATEKSLILSVGYLSHRMPQLRNVSKNFHSILQKPFKKLKHFHLFSTCIFYFHNIMHLSWGKVEIFKVFLKNSLLLIITYYKRKNKHKKKKDKGKFKCFKELENQDHICIELLIKRNHSISYNL